MRSTPRAQSAVAVRASATFGDGMSECQCGHHIHLIFISQIHLKSWPKCILMGLIEVLRLFQMQLVILIFKGNYSAK